MHRTLAILSLLAVVSAIGATGCSSSPPSAPTCDTTVALSFKNDVIPVLQMSCTLTNSCHGQMHSATVVGLYLGENTSSTMTTDPTVVHDQLVGVAAQEDPSMPLVTASDTAKSFLWHKVINDQNTLASECAKATTKCSDCTVNTPCGVLMPFNGYALATDAPDRLCAIQRWILQGAKND